MINSNSAWTLSAEEFQSLVTRLWALKTLSTSQVQALMANRSARLV